MSEYGIVGFELLCVNLYQFEKTVSGEHSFDDAIESIDIGGPAMIRAAAKNASNVLVVVNPSDYDDVLTQLRVGCSLEYRSKLQAQAFGHTAYYDSVIAQYLSQRVGLEPLSTTKATGLQKVADLRYGENSHQSAALYRDPLWKTGIANYKQISGKELSYNNILDSNAAWQLVSEFDEKCCVIVKHGNPCGVALSHDFAEAYSRARSVDTISAFGGIAAINGVVTVSVATAMTAKGNFLEVVLACQFEPEAREIFHQKAGWGQNVRLIELQVTKPAGLTYRSVQGGMLVQTADAEFASDWQVVTQISPSEEEIQTLRFLWKIAKYVKSNAIVVGRSGQLLGVGAGQMNRVQSVRLALGQAGDNAQNGSLASDAFFPFPDSIEAAAAAGITSIVQPGGSKKDDEVIEKANELGVSMVLTGTRHFLH
jgi:phosphoribosylaminoimidazolecarboxamide formyltransferase/IMP cyclohydrolase